jgi:hypothetical protein
MRTYDGKTLDEWRELDPETWPARVRTAIENSDAWREQDPYRYERARDKAERREEAEEAGFDTTRPPLAMHRADIREEIDREGTQFLRRYCAQDADGNLVVTDQVLTELVMVALKGLYYHAARGDLRAMEIIINKCVPEPKQTLDVRVQTMTREEVEAERARILAGLAPGVRAALEARLQRGTDEEGE